MAPIFVDSISKISLLKWDILYKLGKILRLTSLSMLFAGSASVVFTAIVLVKAATQKGVAVSVAATANAPIFLVYSKVIIAACVILLMAEAIDSFYARAHTKLRIMQYISSIVCCIMAFSFAFTIAPQMENLLPYIQTSLSIEKTFHSLHETSRVLFAGIILFAWFSLILPAFENQEAESSSARPTIKVNPKTRHKT